MAPAANLLQEFRVEPKKSKDHDQKFDFCLNLSVCSIELSQQGRTTLVAGAWTERQKMYHGGSFLKLADDNMDIQNPEAQNRAISGF